MKKITRSLFLALLVAGCGEEEGPMGPTERFPPFVRWVTPAVPTQADTNFVFSTDTVTIEISASDDGGKVEQVQVFVADTLAATFTAAPYRGDLDFSNLSNNRSLRVYATATDSSGKVGGSQDTLRFIKSLPPDTATWTVLGAVGPEPRQGHSLSLDRARAQAVLFGGLSRITLLPKNDVWTFDFGSNSWNLQPTGGSVPVERAAHAAGIGGNTLLVFGGLALGDTLAGDVALLNLISWQWDQRFVGPPPTQGMGGTVFSGDIYIYGGAVANDSVTDNIWVFEALDSSWHRRTPASNQPGSRFYPALASDRESGQMFLFGGAPTFANVPASGSNFRLDYQSLSWTSTAAPGPGPRTQAAVVYDSVENRILLWGGRDDLGSHPTEVWEFSLGSRAWRQVPTRGAAVTGRALHRMVMDPDSSRIIMFGGSPPVDNQTWELKW